MNTNSSKADELTIGPLGESALLVKQGEGMTPSKNQLFHALSAELRANLQRGVLDLILGYNTLTVSFDPELVEDEFLRECINNSYQKLEETQKGVGRKVDIPTVYGGEHGSDIEFMAEYCGIDMEKIIQLHTQEEYLVYFIGFLPGFPYLGGLDPRISAPRLDTPREKIPAGSVGIAGIQTGIYPLESPGGWRIIGRTPLKLFDPLQDPPNFLQPGDRIKFVRYASWEEACRVV